MAIETICKVCAKKLRVGDEFAGRKARCPHCKTVYTVPDVPSGGDEVALTPATEQWRVRTQDGAIYGPVSKSELDQWVQEGRVADTSELQQVGTSSWAAATAIYPTLRRGAAGAQASNPFGDQASVPTSVANPYASPSTPHRSRAVAPHRGGMILTFGILGFLCCQIFSIAAWVMGHNDLQEIRAGRMDPQGQGLTQAGMIIGIIGTVLMIIAILLQGVLIAVAAVSEM
jgi:hypothetical protein